MLDQLLTHIRHPVTLAQLQAPEKVDVSGVMFLLKSDKQAL